MPRGKSTVIVPQWKSVSPVGPEIVSPVDRGRFKNTYELLILRALKISILYENEIFQCMGNIFCVEFQRFHLKFHTKYLTHTLKKHPRGRCLMLSAPGELNITSWR